MNDDNAPMYEVVLEIGHYRYRPLTAERLGRSISLIVIVLISSHEREMGAYAVHACLDNRPVVDT